VRVFKGNFKGTYMRLGNSWDLRSCKQKPGESLRDYIRRFSKQRTELPNITYSNIIMAFLSGTTYKELVRELGHNTPITANGLMDIITNFAVGEEVVGAIFGGDQDKGKHKEEDPAGSSRSSKRNGRRRRTSRASSRPRLMTLLLLLITRNLEAPQQGHFRQNAQRAVSLPQRAHEPQPRGLPLAPKIF
jgi:hypothetical protein